VGGCCNDISGYINFPEKLTVSRRTLIPRMSYLVISLGMYKNYHAYTT